MKVTAALNFAANRSHGGVWSNGNREWRTQKLKAQEVELTDARTLKDKPSLAREGFEIHSVPINTPDWDNADWVHTFYLPNSLELIKSLTGAALVLPFYNGGVLIRDTGDMTRAPAADFVHLDNTHASIEFFLGIAADEAIRARYPRVKLFNLWRSVTPPPQDIPLALCDMRTLDEADGVEGRTVEPTFPDGVPYLSAVHNHAQAWYYFSDVSLDEVIVFQGYDNQPSEPMGCLHGAFRLPVVANGAIPRASVEQRIFAFFEQ